MTNIPDFAKLVANTRFLYQVKTFETTPASNVIVLDRAVSAYHENITVFLNKGILTPGTDYDRLDSSGNILPLFDQLNNGQTTYPLIHKINIKQRISPGSSVLIIYSVFAGDYIDYGEINQYVADRLTDFGLQEYINEYLNDNISEIIQTMLPISTVYQRGIIQLAELNDSTSDDKATSPAWYKNQTVLQLFKIPLIDISNESSITYNEFHSTGPRNDPGGSVWNIPPYDYGKFSLHVYVGGTLVQPGITYNEVPPTDGTKRSTQIQWLQTIPVDYNIDIYCAASNIDTEMILHDRLYSTHYFSKIDTRPSDILANQDYSVPTYVVGNDQLEIFIDGIRVHNSIQYDEIGYVGSTSDVIRFKNKIEPSHEIAVYIKPQYHLVSLYNKPALQDYIFYISTIGDDTNEGTSNTYAWRTWECAKKNLAMFNPRDKKFTLVISGKIDEDEYSVNIFDVPGFNENNLTIEGIIPQYDGFNGILKFEGNTSATINNLSARQIYSDGTGSFKSESCTLYLGGQIDFSLSEIFVNGKYSMKDVSVYLKTCQNVLDTDFGTFIFDNTHFYSVGNIIVGDSIFKVNNGVLEFLSESKFFGNITTQNIVTFKTGKIINSNNINLSTLTSFLFNKSYNYLSYTDSEYNIKIFIRVNDDGTFIDENNSLVSIGGSIIKSDIGTYQINHNLQNIKCLVTSNNDIPIVFTSDNADNITTIKAFNLSGALIDSKFSLLIS